MMSGAPSASEGPGREFLTLNAQQQSAVSSAVRAAARGELTQAVSEVRSVLDAEEVEPSVGMQLRKLLIGWFEAMDALDQCRMTATEGVADLRARVGETHELTLVMRHSELYWMCMTGYDQVARDKFPALIRDIERKMGRTHDLAWAARTNSAMPLKRSGDFAGAARIYRRLLRDMSALLEDTDVPMLTTRDNLAEVLACDGQYEESTQLYEALLADVVETRREADPAVLRLRDEIASNLFCLGEHQRARELWAILAEDCRRHLGECAPETARQRTLQIALALQDNDDAGAVRWCRILLDHLPDGFGQEEAEGFRLVMEESQARLEKLDRTRDVE